MPRPHARRLLLAWVTGWAATGAGAQSAAPVGNPLDTLPRPELPTQPGADVRIDVKPPAPPGAEALNRGLMPRRFSIEGVRSIPFDEVAALFAPLAGQPITVAQLVETGQRATAIYQRRGYALSFFFVPAQDFRDGMVRVVAVEGHVQEVRVEGDAGRAEPKLREIAERLRAEKPLRRETFEHVTELLGRLPGISLQAEVRLPASTDGASTLTLKVRRKPYDLAVGLEARKPQPRAVVTGSVNDLLAPGSQIGASTLVSSARNDHYNALNYLQFVGGQGWSLKGTLSRYRGDPNEQLGIEGPLPRETRVQRAEIGASYPLRLSRSSSLTIGLGLYGVDTQDTTSNPANGAYLTDDSRVRVLQGQMAYASHLPERSRQASLTLSHGLKGLGARAGLLSNLPDLSGPSPIELGFTRLQAEASQANRFANGFGTVVSLVLQASPDPLPSSEKTSFGGGRFGRGYASGEAVGDSGWGLGLELNKAFTVDGAWLRQWQPYLLWEAARVYADQGTPLPQKLRSVSLGLRLSDHQRYSVDISASKPTGDTPLDNTRKRWRAGLTLSWRLAGP